MKLIKQINEELKKWVAAALFIFFIGIIQTAFYQIEVYGENQSTYDRQVRNTECNCIGKKLNVSDAKYGAASYQSMTILDHAIKVCKITTKQELNACAGEI